MRNEAGVLSTSLLVLSTSFGILSTTLLVLSTTLSGLSTEWPFLSTNRLILTFCLHAYWLKNTLSPPYHEVLSTSLLDLSTSFGILSTIWLVLSTTLSGLSTEWPFLSTNRLILTFCLHAYWLKNALRSRCPSGLSTRLTFLSTNCLIISFCIIHCFKTVHASGCHNALPTTQGMTAITFLISALPPVQTQQKNARPLSPAFPLFLQIQVFSSRPAFLRYHP